MKDKLRIVFMGTPDFALETLKTIVNHRFNVVGVVTVPDKPIGRGQKIQQLPVKIYAEQQQIPVLQPANLKEEQFIEDLKNLKPDVQVVVAFRMLPKAVWQIPVKGTFNLHASLLPQYRGAAPINWAIINGEKKTGVTTFFIDEKIDTGAVILQEETPITPNETAGTLHDKLMTQGADLVLKTLDKIANNDFQLQKQSQSKILKEAPKIFKDTCRIDWQKDGHTIEYFIRGMSPYPAAWTMLKTKGEEVMIKVYDANFLKMSHKNHIGRIIVDDNNIQIAVKDGYIQIESLQIPGKKRMQAKDFLNGFKFEQSDNVF